MPEEFTNANYNLIGFIDNAKGFVHIWPQTRTVEAYYYQIQQYDSLLTGLPKSYEIYSVSFDPSIQPELYDCVAVRQWKDAKQITIRDVEGGIPYHLSENELVLREFKHLEALSFNISPKTKGLKVETFLYEIKSSTSLTIDVSALDATEIEKFVREQYFVPPPTRVGDDVVAYNIPRRN